MLIPSGLGLTPVLCKSVSNGKPDPTWLRPTYCSVSRAMTRDGTGGWRRPLSKGELALQDRQQLRREMRALRRAVTDEQQSAVAVGLARMAARLRLLRPGRRVAVYFSQGREADLSCVIALARRRGCRLYLPAITHRRHNRMEFVRFDADAKLRRNAFGILEPDVRKAQRIAVRQLDLILVPLVAVDSRGARLGSGAGFYDRRLHHLQSDRPWRRPKLIGVAYEFQRLQQLELQPWDVPLDAVITDLGYYPTRHRT